MTHSFPTRRSSSFPRAGNHLNVISLAVLGRWVPACAGTAASRKRFSERIQSSDQAFFGVVGQVLGVADGAQHARMFTAQIAQQGGLVAGNESEENTSALQTIMRTSYAT